MVDPLLGFVLLCSALSRCLFFSPLAPIGGKRFLFLSSDAMNRVPTLLQCLLLCPLPPKWGQWVYSLHFYSAFCSPPLPPIGGKKVFALNLYGAFCFFNRILF